MHTHTHTLSSAKPRSVMPSRTCGSRKARVPVPHQSSKGAWKGFIQEPTLHRWPSVSSLLPLTPSITGQAVNRSHQDAPGLLPPWDSSQQGLHLHSLLMLENHSPFFLLIMTSNRLLFFLLSLLGPPPLLPPECGCQHSFIWSPPQLVHYNFTAASSKLVDSGLFYTMKKLLRSPNSSYQCRCIHLQFPY